MQGRILLKFNEISLNFTCSSRVITAFPRVLREWKMSDLCNHPRPNSVRKMHTFFPFQSVARKAETTIYVWAPEIGESWKLPLTNATGYVQKSDIDR
jgi:hypothetical protein